MQGMFIGDEETPPECLKRYLSQRMGTRVSILNTGVMGYSPEQYYYSLLAFAERFRPQFVVVSVFTNDFGDFLIVPTKGRGDWVEGKYWLERIIDYCRSREWPCLIVPAPFEPHMFGTRRSGYYPGKLCEYPGMQRVDVRRPDRRFHRRDHLELAIEGERKGKRLRGCPLFNVQIFGWALFAGRLRSLGGDRRPTACPPSRERPSATQGQVSPRARPCRARPTSRTEVGSPSNPVRPIRVPTIRGDLENYPA